MYLNEPSKNVGVYMYNNAFLFSKYILDINSKFIKGGAVVLCNLSTIDFWLTPLDYGH